MQVHPGSPQFADCLARLEVALAYLARHPEFKDAQLYRLKTAALHGRALALAKLAAVDLVNQAAKARGLVLKMTFLFHVFFSFFSTRPPHNKAGF